MSVFDLAWLYGAISACFSVITLAVYLLAGWFKSRRQRDREEMRRHLRDDV